MTTSPHWTRTFYARHGEMVTALSSTAPHPWRVRCREVAIADPVGMPSTTHAARKGMTRVPGGTFLMGSEAFYPEERPIHPVTVDSFYVDEHPVTNAQFRRFVKATGWVTVAERSPDPAEFPDADPAMLVPGSVVFREAPGPVPMDEPYRWWHYVPGAWWKRPQGPLSSTGATGTR